MVADAFEVGDGKGHLRDAVSLVPSHIESSDFDEFLCNGVGEIIDGIFGIFDLLIFIVGRIEEAFDRGFEVFAGDAPHSRDFELSLSEGYGGRQVAFLHEHELAIFEFSGFFGFDANDNLREFDDEGGEREEDDDGNDGKQGVCVCHLPPDVVGRKSDDEIEEWWNG